MSNPSSATRRQLFGNSVVSPESENTRSSTVANSHDGLDSTLVELRHAPALSETPELQSGRTTKRDGPQVGHAYSGLDLSCSKEMALPQGEFRTFGSSAPSKILPKAALTPIAKTPSSLPHDSVDPKFATPGDPRWGTGVSATSHEKDPIEVASLKQELALSEKLRLAILCGLKSGQPVSKVLEVGRIRVGERAVTLTELQAQTDRAFTWLKHSRQLAAKQRDLHSEQCKALSDAANESRVHAEHAQHSLDQLTREVEVLKVERDKAVAECTIQVQKTAEVKAELQQAHQLLQQSEQGFSAKLRVYEIQCRQLESTIEQLASEKLQAQDALRCMTQTESGNKVISPPRATTSCDEVHGDKGRLAELERLASQAAAERDAALAQHKEATAALEDTQANVRDVAQRAQELQRQLSAMDQSKAAEIAALSRQITEVAAQRDEAISSRNTLEALVTTREDTLAQVWELKARVKELEAQREQALKSTGSLVQEIEMQRAKAMEAGQHTRALVTQISNQQYQHQHAQQLLSKQALDAIAERDCAQQLCAQAMREARVLLQQLHETKKGFALPSCENSSITPPSTPQDVAVTDVRGPSLDPAPRSARSLAEELANLQEAARGLAEPGGEVATRKATSDAQKYAQHMERLRESQEIVEQQALELAELRDRVDELQRVRDHSREAYDVVCAELEQANAKLATAACKQQEWRVEVEELQMELTARTALGKERDEEIRAQRYNSKVLGVHLSSLEAEVVETRQATAAHAEEAAAASAQLLSLGRELEETRVMAARAGQQAQTLQMQVDVLESELEQERLNCKMQEEEVQSHRVTVRVMGCQVAELQRRVSETEDENSRLKKLAEELQAEVAAREEDAQRARAATGALESEVVALHRQVETSQQRMSEQQSELSERGRDAAAQHTTTKVLAAHLAQLEAQLSSALHSSALVDPLHQPFDLPDSTGAPRTDRPTCTGVSPESSISRSELLPTQTRDLHAKLTSIEGQLREKLDAEKKKEQRLGAELLELERALESERRESAKCRAETARAREQLEGQRGLWVAELDDWEERCRMWSQRQLALEAEVSDLNQQLADAVTSGQQHTSELQGQLDALQLRLEERERDLAARAGELHRRMDDARDAFQEREVELLERLGDAEAAAATYREEATKLAGELQAAREEAAREEAHTASRHAAAEASDLIRADLEKSLKREADACAAAESELDTLRRQLADAAECYETKCAQAQELEQHLAQVQGEHRALGERLEDSQHRLHEIEGMLEVATSEGQDRLKQIQELQENLGRAEYELQTTSQRSKATSQELERMTAASALMEARLQQLTHEQEEAQALETSTKKRLEEVESLSQTNEQLVGRIAIATREKEDLGSTVSSMSRQLKELTQAKAVALAELAAAQQEKQKLEGVHKANEQLACEMGLAIKDREELQSALGSMSKQLEEAEEEAASELAIAKDHMLVYQSIHQTNEQLVREIQNVTRERDEFSGCLGSVMDQLEDLTKARNKALAELVSARDQMNLFESVHETNERLVSEVTDAHREREELQSTAESLSTELDELTQANRDLAHQLATAQDRMRKLEINDEQNKHLVFDIENATADKEELRCRLESMNKQFEELTQAKLQAVDELATVQDRVRKFEKLHRDNERLVGDIENATGEKEELRINLESMDRQFKELTQAKQQGTIELAAAQEQVRKFEVLHQEYEQLVDEIKSANAEKEELRINLESMTKQFEELTHAKQRAVDELATAQDQMREFEELHEEKERLVGEMENESAEKKELRLNLESMNKQFAELTQAKQLAVDGLATAQEQVHKLERLYQDNERLVGEFENANAENEELRFKLESMKKQFEELAWAKQHALNELATTQEQVREFEKLHEDNKRLVGEMENATAEKKELRFKLESIKKQFEELTQAKQRAVDELATAKDQIVKLEMVQQTNDSLVAELSEAARERDEWCLHIGAESSKNLELLNAAKLQAQVTKEANDLLLSEANLKIKEAERKLDDSMQAQDALRTDLERAEATVARLNAVEHDLTSELEAVTKERDTIKEDLQSAVSTIQKLEELQRQHAAAASQLKAAERQIRANTEAEKRVVELEAELECMARGLVEAQQESATLTATSRATTETLAAQLQVASASWEAALDQLTSAKREADALQGHADQQLALAAKELAEVTSDRDGLRAMLDQERRRMEEMSAAARQEAEAREEALSQLRVVGEMMVEKTEEEEACAMRKLDDAKSEHRKTELQLQEVIKDRDNLADELRVAQEQIDAFAKVEEELMILVEQVKHEDHQGTRLAELEQTHADVLRQLAEVTQQLDATQEELQMLRGSCVLNNGALGPADRAAVCDGDGLFQQLGSPATALDEGACAKQKEFIARSEDRIVLEDPIVESQNEIDGPSHLTKAEETKLRNRLQEEILAQSPSTSIVPGTDLTSENGKCRQQCSSVNNVNLFHLSPMRGAEEWEDSWLLDPVVADLGQVMEAQATTSHQEQNETECCKLPAGRHASQVSGIPNRLVDSAVDMKVFEKSRLAKVEIRWLAYQGKLPLNCQGLHNVGARRARLMTLGWWEQTLRSRTQLQLLHRATHRNQDRMKRYILAAWYAHTCMNLAGHIPAEHSVTMSANSAQTSPMDSECEIGNHQRTTSPGTNRIVVAESAIKKPQHSSSTRAQPHPLLNEPQTRAQAGSKTTPARTGKASSVQQNPPHLSSATRAQVHPNFSSAGFSPMGAGSCHSGSGSRPTNYTSSIPDRASEAGGSTTGSNIPSAFARKSTSKIPSLSNSGVLSSCGRELQQRRPPPGI